MTEFFAALADPDLPFLRHALALGLLASVAFGMVGSLVVVRRITYIAAAIAHCVLGGIGAALWLRHAQGVDWIEPVHGALISAIVSALFIGLVSLYAEQREDTAIGAIWAVGMAIGLVFLARTPSYVDPMSYIWGDILLISRGDLWLIGALDLVVVVLCIFFYNKLLAICFDEEFPRLRGVRSELHYLMLLCLTALTVVLLVDVVGIVLVIALLTLPAAVAGLFARHLWQMMALAVVLCMAFTATGLGLSYRLELPSGPVIILLAGAVFLAVAAVRSVVTAALRRRATRQAWDDGNEDRVASGAPQSGS